ncbi:PAS domain S-box-containing protein [Sagittula marina]|uniref:histidine kinase n=1 Tax=Sagittula marina TaxID=943940 RepID=A0A7W6DMB8_9RHOB|nr:ATP-binding protein [Sagittula marina]MBB3985791.1 PAS domain S-box-containing protein [Sagittula marina]
MALFILREIDQLSRANSDNVQWSLSQADVEFARFQLAIAQADGETGDLSRIRRRFNIFYSRISTLDRGMVYQDVRDDPEFTQHLENVTAFLDRAVDVIDAPDAELTQALPRLGAEASTVLADVRSMSLAGLFGFAEASDARRAGLVGTLAALAVVLGLIFGGLILFAYLLSRLHRLAESRADDVVNASERTRMIVGAAPDAIVVTNRAGAILDFNPEAEALFGCPAREAIGAEVVSNLFPEESRSDLISGPLSCLRSNDIPGAMARHFETVAVDRNGRRFAAELSVAAEPNGTRLVLFLRDISDRKEAETNLTIARDRALAGERAKAEFLAIMSHEMRTPLNGLLGSMQLLRDHSLNERQTDLLDRMEGSGRLLLGLVDDVLDLSKFEAGKMEATRQNFRVSGVLDGVVETAAPLAEANGNTLSWHWLGQQHDAAVGDARRLRQVLLNLVGNAIKFTKGGEVEIEVECLPDGESLEFRVTDTGIGIKEEDLSRIFNDFETLDSTYARQAGGTGLGLGIAKRLTSLMGGEIGAESEFGDGSLFWLRIPIAAAGPVSVQPLFEFNQLVAPRRKLDLLLVEDNEMNRFVARQMLEADGHRVVEAVDGQAGVEWANNRAFDAILMDISMPVMDGIEATRRIRAGSGPSADCPIIAVTAHALPEEVEEFSAAGMTTTVSKPLDRAALLSVLAVITEGATPLSAPSHSGSPDTRLDGHQLSTLLAGLPSGERDEILARFLVETDETIQSIVSDDLPRDALQAQVHACAGNCGTFGASGLRAALAEIETMLKRGEDIAPERLAALAPLWQETRMQISDLSRD